MSQNDVVISFRFRTFDTPDWTNIPMTAEEFLDTGDRAPGERLDMYFVPEHLDPREYVPAPASSVRTVQIRIVDPVDHVERSEEHAYFNHGKCVVIHRQSSVPGHNSNAFVVQIEVAASNTTTTVHFHQEESGINVVSYGADVGDEMVEHLPDDETPGFFAASLVQSWLKEREPELSVDLSPILSDEGDEYWYVMVCCSNRTNNMRESRSFRVHKITKAVEEIGPRTVVRRASAPGK